MTLRELISQAMLEQDVKLQNVFESMDAIHTSKQGVSRVTFLTKALNATHVATGTGPIGLVIWIPRERYNELLSRYGGAKEAAK